MEREPPTISYRVVEEPEPEPEAPVTRTVNRTLQAITWFILVIVLAVWALVGALFWIPLLLRAMIIFSLRLVQSVFVGQRPKGAARLLRDSVSFYKRGFVVAVEVVTREEIEPDARDPDTGNLLFSEILWAALIWYLILLGLGWIQYSPLDLWRDFLAIPWAEMWAAAVGWIRP